MSFLPFLCSLGTSPLRACTRAGALRALPISQALPGGYRWSWVLVPLLFLHCQELEVLGHQRLEIERAKSLLQGSWILDVEALERDYELSYDGTLRRPTDCEFLVVDQNRLCLGTGQSQLCQPDFAPAACQGLSLRLDRWGVFVRLQRPTYVDMQRSDRLTLYLYEASGTQRLRYERSFVYRRY